MLLGGLRGHGLYCCSSVDDQRFMLLARQPSQCYTRVNGVRAGALTRNVVAYADICEAVVVAVAVAMMVVAAVVVMAIVVLA